MELQLWPTRCMMHCHANNSNELSADVRKYLMLCGVPKRCIDKLNNKTRLYHDLSIYGDIAESYIEVLIESYGVEFIDFDFDKFFPREYPGNNIVSRVFFWFVPGLFKVVDNKIYRELNLKMIEMAIRTKKLYGEAPHEPRA